MSPKGDTRHAVSRTRAQLTFSHHASPKPIDICCIELAAVLAMLGSGASMLAKAVATATSPGQAGPGDGTVPRCLEAGSGQDSASSGGIVRDDHPHAPGHANAVGGFAEATEMRVDAADQGRLVEFWHIEQP